MFRRNQYKAPKSKFATRRLYVPPPPSPVAEPHVDEPVIIKPKNKKGRLPGVKLLRQLAKQRRNELIDKKIIELSQASTNRDVP
jgi:hypothetical protein